MDSALSRRTFVGALAGTLGATWLAFNSRELLAAGEHAARSQDTVPPLKVLSLADASEIEAATAQIIPTDETPGAHEARVIYFIDKSLETFAAQDRPRFVKLASELRTAAQRRGAQSFAKLAGADQIAVLESFEKSSPELFNMLRSTTIVGMLANPSYGGNFGKAGWKWIGFNDQFSWAAPFGWYDRNEK